MAELLKWQWLAYWRRILRGGTSVKGNLLVMGLLAVPALARYGTFLRDVRKQTAEGNTSLLEILLAALLLLCLQPGWDAAGLAIGTRDMARFPLSAPHRFGLRVLSRFVSPISWAFVAFIAGGIWPVLALRHPLHSAAAYLFLMAAGFAAGLAVSDLSQTAKAALPIRLAWLALAVGAGLWWAWTRTFPPLPSHLVILAGAGQWWAILFAVILAGIAAYCARCALPWMLKHSPRKGRSRPARSARRMSLLSRELRLQSKLAEVRKNWLISSALGLYLVVADRPEPDALRVMLGVLAFLSIAVAMNSFGFDGVPGLDRFLLMPLKSIRIFLAKNRAFAIAVCGPTLPLAILAAWRFGWREGTADLLEGCALCFAMLAWGNITSVLRPENAGSSAGGNVIDQFLAIIIIGITTAGAIGALRATPQAAPFYLSTLVVVFAALYAGSLWWSAGYFGRQYERIRQALS